MKKSDSSVLKANSRYLESPFLKADLHDTIFAYHHHMRLVALLAGHEKSYTAVIDHSTLTVATTCRRILKHVLKCYDIFRVLCDCRRVVVGMIQTTRFMS